jgi:PPOX class probable F420-dependent enzyme
MSAGESAAYLIGGATAILVTIGFDGLPHPVPMWYVVGDGDVHMRTYASSQKVTNIRRDSRVACLVTDGDRYEDLRGVQLIGRIELIDDLDWIADVVVRLRIKYEGLDPGDAAAELPTARQTVGKQIGLRLRADKVVSWDHGKLSH